MLCAQEIAKNEIGGKELEILFAEYSKPFEIFNLDAYCFLEEQQSFWT